MASEEPKAGTNAIILSTEGPGIYEPAIAMASILELTDPRTGEGHHTPTHYVSEPETYYLVKHCLGGRLVTESVPAKHLRIPKFCIGQRVFLGHNLRFWWDRKGRFRHYASKIGLDGPFRIVGIAYSVDSLEDGAAEAEYWVQIGDGGGGPRRWWRERWLRGSQEPEGTVAEQE
jgi:hypothetical protein